MLVFARAPGQSIVIGDPANPIAEIHIGAIVNPKKVRIAVKADPSIPVNRREVADAIIEREGVI